MSFPTVRTIEDVRRLRWQDLVMEDLPEATVEDLLRVCGAYWRHSGDPKEPHVEITTKKCTDSYVDVLRALKHANLCHLLALQMTRLIRKKCEEIHWGLPQWVVGSDHAGAAFSHSVAIWLSAEHDFAEKSSLFDLQLWQRFPIPPGATVLNVEELITTRSTVSNVREGIRNGSVPHRVTFMPFIAALVDRSEPDEDADPIISLVRHRINKSESADCQLCKQGSRRLRPKQHWTELTGR